MSHQLQFWLLIVLLGAGTWTMRSVPILLHGKVAEPAWLERILRHVPVAALTAMVVPSVLYTHLGDVYSFAPSRVIAAVIALVVALRTRNVLATLAVGMIALWVSQWAIGLLG
jgi:branched-subunit amino acid transport protein